MSRHADTEVRDVAGDAAARHVRIWLAASGSSYDASARELFVRAHPVLFGRAWELTLNGMIAGAGAGACMTPRLPSPAISCSATSDGLRLKATQAQWHPA